MDPYCSLPYIDPQPDPAQAAIVAALIAAELPLTPRPALPPLPPPRFSPLIAAELARLARRAPLAALDERRYVLPPLPSPAALRTAAVLSTYLLARLDNLALLAAHGPRAWIAAAAAQEALCRRLDAQLDALRASTDACNRARKLAQLHAHESALRPLQDSWARLLASVLQVNAVVRTLQPE